ncbi:MAG: hypothetical protein EPO64_05630 [Nitrospirae bacterium]|nr:MAG: hypothetical protein EPO64_05630 [Nitrospirota bacterium]
MSVRDRWLDPIILGHNAFFGVNHLSAEAGNRTAQQFQDPTRIIELVRFCSQLGVSAMMMSTHDRAGSIARLLHDDTELRDSVSLYALVPYIAKYVRHANEKGLVNVLVDQLSGGHAVTGKVKAMVRGSVGFLRGDVEAMLLSLVDLELAVFQGLNLKVVFLHDTLTDLAIGWKLSHLLKRFAEHVATKHGARAGFCTKNVPALLTTCRDAGLEHPLIMAAVNKVGFQVNPSLPDLEKSLGSEDLDLVAMSTLAAGYLKPEEAFAYLASVPQLRSLVIGASSPRHAEETFAAARRHLPHKNT